MELRAEDVDALVLGAALLGSGGGGTTIEVGTLLRRKLGAGSVVLHSPSDLAGAFVVPVGVIGATTVLTEKLPNGQEFAAAVHALCQWADIEPEALMASEAGGVNGLTALVAALELQVPFIDADLMGRAFPRLDQLTWAVDSDHLFPIALAGTSGQIVIIDRAPARTIEGLARAALRELGGWAAAAFPPRPAADLASSAILGSISRAIALGSALKELPEAASPRAVESATGARVLGAGRVFDVSRHRVADGTFGHGHISLRDRDADSIIRIECQNEYLLASVNGRLEAQAPDILCLLERRKLVPIEVDQVRAGDELIALHLSGPSWWWASPARRKRVDPTAFGIPTLLSEERE